MPLLGSQSEPLTGKQKKASSKLTVTEHLASAVLMLTQESDKKEKKSYLPW